MSSSGGNAGLAAAYAAREFKLQAHIFCPVSTLGFVIERLRGMGAIVSCQGQDWNAAHELALAFLKEMEAKYGKSSTLFVHPFEHPLIWEGHSTLVKELAEEKLDPDLIICAVGGGGLACGILRGLIESRNNDIKSSVSAGPVVVAVETEGAASFAASVNNNHQLTSIDKITSVATSLGAKTVTSSLLDLTAEYGKDRVKSVVVSDKEAVEAVVNFANESRFLVEPACGAALSLLYSQTGREKLKHIFEEVVFTKDFSTIKTVVIVCGGSGVTLDMIQQWKSTYLDQ